MAGCALVPRQVGLHSRALSRFGSSRVHLLLRGDGEVTLAQMASVARDVVRPRRCTVYSHGCSEAVCRSPPLRLQAGDTQASVPAADGSCAVDMEALRRTFGPNSSP